MITFTYSSFIKSLVSNQNFGIVDLLRETWNRVSGFKSNYRARLIPFWSLVLPTTSYFVGFHLISYGMKGVFRQLSSIYKKVFDENVNRSVLFSQTFKLHHILYYSILQFLAKTNSWSRGRDTCWKSIHQLVNRFSSSN